MLPSSADGTLFPAACALLLAALGAAQFALTPPVEPPAAGYGGGGVRVALPQASADPIDPILATAPMFSPARTMGNVPGEPASRPSWQLAGSMTLRGRTVAILQGPGGRVLRLSRGQSVDGMRLLAIDAEGATFLQGGERVTVAYGSGAVAVSADTDGEEAE